MELAILAREPNSQINRSLRNLYNKWWAGGAGFDWDEIESFFAQAPGLPMQEEEPPEPPILEPPEPIDEELLDEIAAQLADVGDVDFGTIPPDTECYDIRSPPSLGTPSGSATPPLSKARTEGAFAPVQRSLGTNVTPDFKPPETSGGEDPSETSRLAGDPSFPRCVRTISRVATLRSHFEPDGTGPSRHRQDVGPGIPTDVGPPFSGGGRTSRAAPAPGTGGLTMAELEASMLSELTSAQEVERAVAIRLQWTEMQAGTEVTQARQCAEHFQESYEAEIEENARLTRWVMEEGERIRRDAEDAMRESHGRLEAAVAAKLAAMDPHDERKS